MPIPMVEWGWIAGFLEGEGYFGLAGKRNTTIKLEAGQVDVSPIDRLHGWFGGRVWMEPRAGEHGRYRGNRQPYWRWQADSAMAIQIIMTIWPLVGTKRRIEIEKCIMAWKESQGAPEPVTVCKKCGSSLSPENIEWVSREDGKGRRKWCKSCGQRVS